MRTAEEAEVFTESSSSFPREPFPAGRMARPTRRRDQTLATKPIPGASVSVSGKFARWYRGIVRAGSVASTVQSSTRHPSRSSSRVYSRQRAATPPAPLMSVTDGTRRRSTPRSRIVRAGGRSDRGASARGPSEREAREGPRGRARAIAVARRLETRAETSGAAATGTRRARPGRLPRTPSSVRTRGGRRRIVGSEARDGRCRGVGAACVAYGSQSRNYEIRTERKRGVTNRRKTRRARTMSPRRKRKADAHGGVVRLSFARAPGIGHARDGRTPREERRSP